MGGADLLAPPTRRHWSEFGSVFVRWPDKQVRRSSTYGRTVVRSARRGRIQTARRTAAGRAADVSVFRPRPAAEQNARKTNVEKIRVQR